MAISDWFRGVFQQKNSPSRSMISFHRLGQPVSTPKNFEGYSKEGFQKNVVAYRAVLGISQGIAGLKWVLYKKRRGGTPQEITEHELLTLLKRPNPMQGGAAFFEAMSAFFSLSGNSYCEAVGPSPGAPPSELWVARPDRMRIVPGAYGMPQAFEYSIGGLKHKYEVDQIKGSSPILHLKTFNPTDDWYGMSPVQAASLAVDQHNESGVWNLSLLQNKATPSGALVVSVSDKNPTGKLDPEQYDRLDKKLEQKFKGAQNAGRPHLLEGGLDWKQMGFAPSDMDWINGKNTSAREIALAFGYPPILLGIPGDSTYNNQKEARLALYEEAILPQATFIRDELNNWLTPAFGDDLYLDYDRDQIDALAIKREAIWTRVETSNFLTINEKREAVGYERVEGGDTLFVNAGQLPLELATDPEFGMPEQEEEDLSDFEEETEDDDSKSSGKSLEYKNSESRFESYVKMFTERYVGDRITKISGVTRRHVIKSVREAQLEFLQEGSNITQLSDAIHKKISSTYSTFTKSRARTIARTETTVAANEGSRAAAKALNLPKLRKEWVSGDDGRVRGSDLDDATNHKNMNGVKVGIDEKFLVPSIDGPDEMDGPGDPSAPVDQVANCRCIQVYEDEQKSFNLGTSKSKQSIWLKTVRQRNALERKFTAQVGAVFKKEMDELLSGLEGIEDAKLAELTADRILADTQADLEAVFKSNIIFILRTFGKDVLKLRS